MKLSVEEVVKAYTAVHELVAIPLPFVKARQVATLRNRLQEEINIIMQEEAKLAQEFGGQREQKGYVFPDTKSAQKFNEKYQEMIATEDEYVLPKVDLSDDIDKVNITPSAVEILEKIIKFEVR